MHVHNEESYQSLFLHKNGVCQQGDQMSLRTIDQKVAQPHFLSKLEYTQVHNVCIHMYLHGCLPELLDGLISNQKSKFEHILEGLGM
jgi:hypothetical protein